ncbi:MULTISPECIES: hypothetical protein [unclassified Oceanispirochaeta]|uniref:hypothetical protein n=1 Tax=unclassified Oceanispirochaeta TaxID=2635722 RepID=UPI000E094C14|nr:MULTISPECIES: hypothetical protein [unclassified Oceanispirochaeta]MBF9018867.1 hypothetical protein [Oceanispirochaeta sp. M2]NPD75355.1 hypothetical protein [Oceanispirochaeta sp. M1]RDG28805.1 hypothetical protein DV872_24990 [Oceanispirochaeta sp. M1]
MKIFKRFLAVLAVILAVAGCKTYDQSFDWVEGSDIEGVFLSVTGVSRGIVEFSMTNNGTQDQIAVILPRSSIIGYRKDLNRNTDRAYKPGTFTGEPHFVRPIGGSQLNENGLPDIYGSFSLSYNDIIIAPGETVYTQLYLNNWDRATENFIARVHFLVREGDVRNRIVLEIPAESFFNSNTSQKGSGSLLKTGNTTRKSN